MSIMVHCASRANIRVALAHDPHAGVAMAIDSRGCPSIKRTKFHAQHRCHDITSKCSFWLRKLCTKIWNAHATERMLEKMRIDSRLYA